MRANSRMSSWLSLYGGSARPTDAILGILTGYADRLNTQVHLRFLPMAIGGTMHSLVVCINGLLPQSSETCQRFANCKASPEQICNLLIRWARSLSAQIFLKSWQSVFPCRCGINQ